MKVVIQSGAFGPDPWKVVQKDNKKKVGVNVAINIRADRMKDFSVVRALIQFQGTIER